MKLFRWVPLSSVLLILLPAAGAGTLTATFNAIPAGSAVNLTAQGTADWVHWGLLTEASVDRKANVAPQIGNITPVAASGGYVYMYQYADNYNGYTWSDGTPTMSVANTPTGV